MGTSAINIFHQCDFSYMQISPYRCCYNAILSLNNAKWSVDTLEKLSASEHPQISVEELLACEKVVKNDPRVQKLAKAVGKLFSHHS